MNREEAREEWKKRLRSGDYEQVFGALCIPRHGHCCLGVLSEIMAEEGMIEKTVNEDESYASFGIWGDKTYTVLPEIVAKFIGLITKNGGHITDNKVCLADLNDHGKTFTEIADLLETGEFWKENAPPTDTRTMID